MWPIALRATWMTLVTAFACLGIGLLAIRLLTKPLRHLSEAAGVIGQGSRVAIRESGPTDLRNLGRAMNEMQDRIARLLEDQARSFEAISHDLRTPLARQKIAADLITDREVGDILHQSVDEMEAMLQSLQRFLRAQHLSSEPEPVDLNALLRHLIEPLGHRVHFTTLTPATVESYREPLLLSLEALFENALQYGETIDVTVANVARDWFIEIKDDGPGIPAQHFGDVLAPFFRLDEARGRTTKGFGLGIPTAHRLLTRFGGKLSFFAAAEGGLIVRIQVPRPHLPTR
jgi:signal transduction histidine kinase